MNLAELQHLLLLELPVALHRHRRQRHIHPVRQQVGQLQVVLSLHRQADVRYLVTDNSLTAFLHATPHDDVVPLVRLEINLTVLGHRLPQPLAHVQAVHLSPQVYQTVRRGSAGQTYHALHRRNRYAHRLETLALRTLETRQLVYHQHVERQHAAVLAHQPHEVVTAGHIHVGLLLQRHATLLLRTKHLHHPEALQVLPLLGLRRPSRLGYLLRGHHQHSAHLAVVHQVLQSGQRTHRLAQSHVEEQTATLMLLDPTHRCALVLVWPVYHNSLIIKSTPSRLSIT